jgi:uncharacterized protein YjbI with pentapeptide repeats
LVTTTADNGDAVRSMLPKRKERRARVAFTRVDFTRVDFTRVDFTRVDFTRVDFTRVDFTRVDFKIEDEECSIEMSLFTS